MYLVTSGTEDALRVEGSGSFFPVHVHTGSKECRNRRSKECSLGVVLLGWCMESDFDVLPWGRGRELELEGYVELVLILWDVDFLPVKVIVAAISRD